MTGGVFASKDIKTFSNLLNTLVKHIALVYNTAPKQKPLIVSTIFYVFVVRCELHATINVVYFATKTRKKNSRTFTSSALV